MLKTAMKAALLLTVLALLMILIPSAIPLAGAEGVLPRYSPVMLWAQSASPIDYQSATPYAPHKDCYLEDQSGYIDDTISVYIETFRAYDTTIQATWVQIASPTQLRAALNRPYPSKELNTADRIARRENAVLAINGDYFIYINTGYNMRNGKLLLDKPNKAYDTLIIDEAGDLHIIQATTREALDAYFASGGTAVHTFTFGPGLVVDGVKADIAFDKQKATEKETQRMGIGQMDTLSYLILTTEGPENAGSTGLTLDEFAQLFSDMGARNAYNLDGGSSSSLVLDGQKINALSTHKNRVIGDIIYFVTAMPEGGAN
ncbi:MAG: phosphodiester glycosidase family protein [bacterium]|nr:phosphodiester glycosidase family protein [bacterium]